MSCLSVGSVLVCVILNPVLRMLPEIDRDKQSNCSEWRLYISMLYLFTFCQIAFFTLKIRRAFW